MNNSIKFIELSEVDSTSRYLKDFCEKTLPEDCVCCLAKKQTQGYGQQGRGWLTNDDSLVFSLAVPLPRKAMVDGSVGLKVAVSLHQALEQAAGEANVNNNNLQLKWPNDIYVQGKKACGMLLEQVVTSNAKYLVIGVGINQSSINAEFGFVVGLNQKAFFEKLLVLLSCNNLSKFLTVNVKEVVCYWQAHDFFTNGEALNLHTKAGALEEIVTYQGVLESGQVAIINKDSALVTLASGVESLRKIKS